MALPDTRWRRLRNGIRPATRLVPGGHLASAAASYARLVLPRRPERRFVIFAQGRSGSTLLMDLLNAHPAVFCEDEILTWPRRWPVAYATACSAGRRCEVYGFKVKIYQLTDAQRLDDPGSFLRALHNRGWHVIALRRRNVVRQALSAMVAAQRGAYHQVVGAPGPAPTGVVIDGHELRRRAEQRERFLIAEEAALAGIPHLALEYEEHLLHPGSHQRTASAVFDHLGIEDAVVHTRLTKIADRPVAETVANYEDLVAALEGTRYRDLLDQA